MLPGAVNFVSDALHISGILHCGTLYSQMGSNISARIRFGPTPLSKTLGMGHIHIFLDGDFLAHLLTLRCYLVILPLQFVDKTIRIAVNGRLVPFPHWYQNAAAELGIICSVRQKVLERDSVAGYSSACFSILVDVELYGGY